MITEQEVSFLLESRLEDLTEAQLEFLVENRIEFIKNANKDKISTEHDPESSSHSSDKIVDIIANKIDPTSNKSHTQWLVNQYKKGGFKLSEAKDIKKTMNAYEDTKPHINIKDIGQFKDISHLKDVIANKKEKVKLAEEANKENSAPTDLQQVFDEDGYKGYKIPSKNSSIKNYGPAGKMAQTSWCTASTGTHNMFNGYEGGKYTLHTPDGKVLQLHHQSDQLKDARDYEIDLNASDFKEHSNTIRKFVDHTSKLENLPGSRLKARIVGTSHEDIEHLFKEHANAISELKDHIAKDSYNVYTKASDAATSEQNLIDNLKKSKDISDEHFERLKNLEVFHGSRYSVSPESIKHADVTHRLLDTNYGDGDHSIDLTDHQISHILKTQTNPEWLSHEKVSKLLSSSKASDDIKHEIIGKALSNPHTIRGSDTAHQILSKSKNLSEDHVRRLMPRLNLNAIGYIDSRTNHLPKEVQDAMLKNNATTSLASQHYLHPDIKDALIEKAQTDHEHISSMFENHHAFSSDDMHKILDNPIHPKVSFNALFDRYDITPEHVDKVVKHATTLDLSNGYQPRWLMSTKLSKEHIAKIIDSGANVNYMIRSHGPSLHLNPRFKSSDIDALIAKNPANIDAQMATIKSDAAKPKQVHTVIDNMLSSNSEKLYSKHHSIYAALDEIPHHKIGEDTLHLIATSPITKTTQKHRLLQHPSTGVETFKHLADNVSMHGAISNSKHAPPSILHSLATSPLDHVRLNVAGNQNTEQKTLRILATDQNEEVAALAKKKIK